MDGQMDDEVTQLKPLMRWKNCEWYRSRDTSGRVKSEQVKSKVH